MRFLYRDRYTVVAWLLFLVEGVLRWQGHVRVHEAIYLLGSKRVVDPELLARDLTWGVLPPTTFVFDHLLAPLGLFLGDFALVNLGRAVVAALFGWSLAMLAREMRWPAWSVVAGFVVWVFAGQTLLSCGAPLDGFQPKSPSYPLLFFALVFAMREQYVRAGLAAGLAAAFHIIIGGWGCLALLIALALHRVPARGVIRYLLGTAPFCGPLVLAVGLFHAGGAAGQQGLMDAIYVRFAEPHCADPSFFMNPKRWAQVVAVFAVSPPLLYLWPGARRVLARFVFVLVVFGVAGLLASGFDAYVFLKVMPFQLAASLPALFLFILALGGVTVPEWPGRAGRVVWGLAAVAAIWLADDEDAVVKAAKAPAAFIDEVTERDPPGLYGSHSRTASRQPLYAWIREHTPRDALFITPYLPEFWTYAERAQVVSFRHPPLNERLIEWQARLEALNQGRTFERRGFECTDELDEGVNGLSVAELAQLRDRYGAMFYLSRVARPELEAWLLFETRDLLLYGLEGLR